MNPALAATKPWYLHQFNHAVMFGLAAMAFGGVLLYKLGDNQEAFWLELLKLATLLGFFIQRVFLARKHPESEEYIYDGFTWTAMLSAFTDIAWVTNLRR